MSNKLKTLSASQLEHLIADTVGEYLEEDCTCTISNLDTPYIDTEADIALDDKRDLTFEVRLTYTD
ncbi:hypothetical protein G3570_03975 [Balneolaceae bacterium YR4-1]|uniref:Uncharacterized protein n=1 Tax=Halalkalibaculum roseum TaxID=2709311 RepID=A0A6M1SUG4_9BACT|nr:hypothetical protein [Halalkalibaculum roseum]NGP75776.1 hypothetical protein [Halalkalibaculum roseum]